MSSGNKEATGIIPYPLHSGHTKMIFVLIIQFPFSIFTKTGWEKQNFLSKETSFKARRKI